MDPVPKPRRFHTSTVSITDLKVTPVPAPRSVKTIIRLRSPLTERAVPAVCIDSGCISADCAPSTSYIPSATHLPCELSVQESKYMDLKAGITSAGGSIGSSRTDEDVSTGCTMDDNDVTVHVEDITQTEPCTSHISDAGLSTCNNRDTSDTNALNFGPDWVIPAQIISFNSEEHPEELERYGVISPPPVTPNVPLTLLQQLVISHPVWYMPYLDRDSTTNYLYNKEPGAFLVRGCSLQGCVALSVRMPPGGPKWVDHFVIEPSGGRGFVHLRQSRLVFNSLPDLLEFYTRIPGELPVKLTLPQRILNCTNRDTLEKLVCRPQDFWNPVWDIPRVDSRTLMVEDGCTSFLGPQPVPLSLNETQKGANQGFHPLDSRRWHGPQAQRGGIISGSKEDLISVCSMAHSRDDVPTAEQWIHSRSTELSARRVIPVSVPSIPPQKIKRQSSCTHVSSDRPVSHHIEKEDLLLKPEYLLLRNGRRSQSVRDRNPKDGTTRKKSFLKSLLFFKDEKAPESLAELKAFSPRQDKMNKGYNSAFDIGELGNHMHSPTFGNRSLMRTFKPLPGELANIGRPLPPQPAGTPDKNDRNGLRLARHNEGSPGPTPQMARQPMLPPSNVFDLNARQMCMDMLRMTRVNASAANSSTKCCMDTLSSLQRHTHSSEYSAKKLSSAGTRLNTPTSSMQQQSPESPKPVLRSFGFHSKKDHRLSVPNLADPSAPALYPHVIESAKALKEKLGRNVDGELGPINEGLVTPVVRRKIFHRDAPLEESPSADHTYSPVMQRSDRPAKESDLIWRRTKTSGPLSDLPNNSGDCANRIGCVFDRQSGNWTAVNSEVKARQKSSKRNSMQLRTIAPQQATVGGISSAEETVRPSEYAQLADLNVSDIPFRKSNEDDDAVSVAGTVFNEPWDSNVWENLLDLATVSDQGTRLRRRAQVETVPEEESDDHSSPLKQGEREGLLAERISPAEVESRRDYDGESKFSTIDSRRMKGLARNNAVSPTPASILSLPRPSSRISHLECMGSIDDLPTNVPRMSPIMNCRVKYREGPEAVVVIQHYVETLSLDESTIFGATLARFFECTEESGETDPTVIIRNTRQFITGLKNYLMKQGEGKLHTLIDDERRRLNANQILSVDVVLEAVLHRIVLKKMKTQLYSLMIHDLTQMGALEAMTTNLRIVREFGPKELGFDHPEEIVLPDKQTMDEVRTAVKKMQAHYSPTKKVENLLKAIGCILRLQTFSADENLRDERKVPRADDIVRWFIFLIARTSAVTIEVEAWYMYELLPQQMLDQGDSTYYLTALLSAIHILKNANALTTLSDNCHDIMSKIDMRSATFSGPPGDAFLKVAIPDANLGCVKYASFPGIPQMNAQKLCRVIAHSQGITNPEDYGLYLVLDGFETPVQPTDFPDLVRDKIRLTGKNFLLAYKRHDAKIAWPMTVLSGLALC